MLRFGSRNRGKSAAKVAPVKLKNYTSQERKRIETKNPIISGPTQNEGVNTRFSASEIVRLGRRFAKLDADNSGTVSMKEFLQIPEIKGNVLANRVVEVFDTNNNGEVDFREFVLGMSQFSTASNIEGRLRFAFRIYDLDNNGVISNGELFHIVKAMVGDNLTDVQIQQVVDHTFQFGDTNHDGVISFKEFAAMVGPRNAALQNDRVISAV